MKIDFYKIFSKFTVGKIEIINILSHIDTGATSTVYLERKFKIHGQNLGGILSSLCRTKIDGEPLVKVIARDAHEGKIWQFNENIVSKEEIRKVTDDILSKVGKWRMNK